MSYIFQDNPIHVVASLEAESPDETSTDIIALHGLGGAWDTSWTSNGYCWLSDALPSKFPSNRIILVNHPSMLRDLAVVPLDVTGLVLDLIRERRQSGHVESPIVFVGHSFGGTILKQIYVATHPSSSSNPDFHKLHRSVRGYVYLGTPHNDFHPPDISKLWRALGAEAVNSLGARSSDLEKAIFATFGINHAFQRLGGADLPTVCFYETEKTLVGISKMHIVSQNEATLSGRSVESIPLDLRHQGLGKYSHDKDNNLLRVLGVLERFMVTVQGPRVRRGGTGHNGKRRLKLLCLDGGGVKGFFTILVIQRLVGEAQRLEGNPASGKRPCDYFDLIGGTSTGGLLAIMLGRLQMDVNSCIIAYRSLSKKIFYRSSWLQFLRPFHTVGSMVLGLPWYSGELLKFVICQTVKDHISVSERESLAEGGYEVEDLRLASTKPHKSRCFVCAVPAGQRKVERIRSYRSIDPAARDTSSYTIWEAARATSAAPLYFPSIKVHGIDYFDGGLDSNNPVVEVIEEARREFPEAVIDTVVSIGTGMGTIPDPVPPFSNILLHFINRSTDTEGQHERVMTEPVFEDVRNGYFRFQGETDLGEIDLADANKLDEIEELAKKYLASSTGRHMIASCAAKLVSA